MAKQPRYAAGTPRNISTAEQECVADVLKLFSELQTYRNVHAGMWEESAQLILPTSRNTFFYGSYNWPGQKKTQQQIDATGALALSQFCAIADSLVTPKNQKWHGLKSDPYVMKDRMTREYFDTVRDILFDFRYRPIGNFHGQNFNNWQSLGAFGNSVMFVDAFDGRWHHNARGFRYKSVPLGETFFGENHQGVVTTMVRWFRRTASQAVEAWGIERLPANLKSALDTNSQAPFNFLHCVRPRGDDYDPQRLDEKGKPFSSCYISIEGKCLMEPESGFRVFPYAVSRYDQTPGEVYGRGPAMLVLPGLKTLNAEKTVFLKTGHRAGDPVLLLPEDGLIDGFSLRPGSANPGGVNADGRPMVHTLPVGDVHITKEMMDEERSIIETTFLTSLFKVLTQHPDMTATQVIELLNERGMLVAPTLGRQHNEYVGGLVEREMDLAGDMRDHRGRPILPPMPPRLKEAMGEYQIEDTSPLAMSAKFNQAAGFNRWVEQLHQWAAISGDMSILDSVEFDVAGPETGQIQGVPTRWISSDEKIMAKRKSRAQAQQQEQAVQAAPAQAAVMKAVAAQAKAGIGQQATQAPGVPA